VHFVAQLPPPSIWRHAASVPHSTSVAHARHSCGAFGMHSFVVSPASSTSRQFQSAGQSSSHVRVHTPPTPPIASTQWPLTQSPWRVQGSPSSPVGMPASCCVGPDASAVSFDGPHAASVTSSATIIATTAATISRVGVTDRSRSSV
jgi:hypothetical protein